MGLRRLCRRCRRTSVRTVGARLAGRKASKAERLLRGLAIPESRNPGFRSPAERDRFILGFSRVARVAGWQLIRMERYNLIERRRLKMTCFDTPTRGEILRRRLQYP